MTETSEELGQLLSSRETIESCQQTSVLVDASQQVDASQRTDPLTALNLSISPQATIAVKPSKPTNLLSAYKFRLPSDLTIQIETFRDEKRSISNWRNIEKSTIIGIVISICMAIIGFCYITYKIIERGSVKVTECIYFLILFLTIVTLIYNLKYPAIVVVKWYKSK